MSTKSIGRVARTGSVSTDVDHPPVRCAGDRVLPQPPIVGVDPGAHLGESVPGQHLLEPALPIGEQAAHGVPGQGTPAPGLVGRPLGVVGDLREPVGGDPSGDELAEPGGVHADPLEVLGGCRRVPVPGGRRGEGQAQQQRGHLVAPAGGTPQQLEVDGFDPQPLVGELQQGGRLDDELLGRPALAGEPLAVDGVPAQRGTSGRRRARLPAARATTRSCPRGSPARAATGRRSAAPSGEGSDRVRACVAGSMSNAAARSSTRSGRRTPGCSWLCRCRGAGRRPPRAAPGPGETYPGA